MPSSLASVLPFHLYVRGAASADSSRTYCAKLLGIYLSDTLQLETHLVNVLKICSQRTYLLKLLRDQGMPRTHLNTVFIA